jgi:hypothetical protein
MFPPDGTQIQDRHNKKLAARHTAPIFCLRFNIRSTIYGFVSEWYNLQPSNLWIRFVVYSCSSHPVVLAATDKWTMSRAPVEHASMYILPNFIHARLSALIGRISMSSKTPGAEYGAYSRCLYFVWVLWLHLARVWKTSHSSFPFTRYSTTHPGASSEVWIDISNLNLPRIIDTVAKCEPQTLQIT